MPQLTASIIIIGNEILSGRTQDVNIQFIAQRLVNLGIRLESVTIIPDVHEIIIGTINNLRKKHTYIFTTGGIGPTHDDITSKAVAAAFNLPFEPHSEAYKILLNFYGKKAFTPARQKMTFMPRGAILIDNTVTSAPAFQVENVYVLAGFPKIMREMFKNLEITLKIGDPIFSNSTHCHIAESIIAQGLEVIQQQHPCLDIGSYPFYESDTNNGTSLVVKGTKKSSIDTAIIKIEQLIIDYGGTPLTDNEFQRPQKT